MRRVADLSSTIDIIFRGIDQASDTAEKVSKSLGELNSSARDVVEPFADLAGKVAIAQAALLALTGTLGAISYGEAAKFQSSLLELQKQLDDNEGSASDYAAALEKLAVRYGTNANDLVKSAADFKAAGYDIETSIKLVKGSLDLMIAGGVSADQAVQVMNRSLAGFQVPAADVVRESQHIGDVLKKTADITKSSFTEISTGFADLSPIARLTGLSMEQVAAVLTTVIDTFGSGSEAANGLKTGFLRLVAPTNETADAMAALGVKFDAAGKPIGTVKQLLDTMAPAFAKLADTQKLALAADLFGAEQASRMVEALGKYGDAMKLAAQLTREAGGSIERQVTIQLGAAEAQLNSTNEAWRQFATALGNKILIDTSGVIGSLGELGLALKNVIQGGGLDPLFDLLAPQLQKLSETFSAAARTLPDAFAKVDFSGLVKALGNLGEEGSKALEALFGPIDITTLDGLKNAIQQVVDVLTGLTNVTAGELAGLQPFLAGMREMVLSFKDAKAESQNFIGSLLGWSVGLKGLTDFLAPLNTALLGLIALGGPVKTVLAGIGGEIALLGSALSGGALTAALGEAGLAGAVGALTFQLTRYSGLDTKLNDILAIDAFAGYEGATVGTVVADAVDAVKQWTGAVADAGAASDAAKDKFNVRIPASQWDGAISSIARFEEAIRQNEAEYNDYLALFEKPLPATQTDGVLSRLDEIAAKSRETQKALEQALGYGPKGDGKGYDVKINFDSEGNIIPELSTQLGALGIAVDGVNAKLVDTGEKIKVVKIVGDDGTVTYRNLEQQFGKSAKAAKDMGDASAKTAKDILESTKAANDFQVKMEQIASNERIKLIEAKVTLNVAQLEADTKRVEAAFQSINETIKSTGDVLGGLYKEFGDAKNKSDKWDIAKWIDDENARRDAALKKQNELVDAQIKAMEARTDALNRGDSMLTVHADGLKPHLEAFMWEILKAIEVRASADLQQFLLGVAA